MSNKLQYFTKAKTFIKYRVDGFILLFRFRHALGFKYGLEYQHSWDVYWLSVVLTDKFYRSVLKQNTAATLHIQINHLGICWCLYRLQIISEEQLFLQLYQTPLLHITRVTALLSHFMETLYAWRPKYTQYVALLPIILCSGNQGVFLQHFFFHKYSY
jgi:hypothetical protein